MAKIKILILTANPQNTNALRLGEEVRNIEAELERAHNRDCFELVSQWAVRVNDLTRALLKYNPHIVHFSGHGGGEHGLALENDAGNTQLVSTKGLTQLFELVRNKVKCVFLNACYSKVQAEAIHQHIDCLIGMSKAIGDRAAIQFAGQFYQALAAGKSFLFAYEAATAGLDLSGSHESTTPVLLTRNEDEDPFGILQTKSETSPEITQPPMPAPQSQSIGNITISGNSNAFTNVQSGGDVNLTRSQNQEQASNSDLEAALAAIANLKQNIAATEDLNPIEKATVEVPISMLETELQKPQPDKSLIDQAIAALQKSLNGVVTLAEPVAKVATLVAKAWGGLP
ncbi:MAG: CHAT domain-containing protein [Leptolyngbya sp. SIO1E4]|nr:CHAT domain-containing protein [Leptolyngbya sp. SIO1E4]